MKTVELQQLSDMDFNYHTLPLNLSSHFKIDFTLFEITSRFFTHSLLVRFRVAKDWMSVFLTFFPIQIPY